MRHRRRRRERRYRRRRRPRRDRDRDEHRTAPTADDGTATGGASSQPPAESKPDQGAGEKCTDRLDYAGDPRSNAEINSIGADTGTCPEPQPGTPSSGTPKEDGATCTDQVNYAGDPRPNAEINSIGEETGTCPPVQDK